MALFNREPEKNVKIEPTTKGPLPPPLPQPKAAPPPPPTIAVQPERAPVAAPPAVRQAIPASIEPVAATDATAYFDKTSRISGKLSFEAATQLDGTVEGEIIAKGHLVIGESAVITAQIRAASIVVAGKISGDIVATHRIEIRPAGRVIGNLSAPSFVVHEGALFEGHCSMQSDAAQNERKVTVFPKDDRTVNGNASTGPAAEVSVQKSA
ncbi:MAG: polymer-forming cytoskeletal protein [Candidatus Binataceae bacterium]|jgi:cytoskeletal protein CcmA (bactofilin family)